MHLSRTSTVFSALALTLVLSVDSWAQQVRIIDCGGNGSYGSDLAGCEEFDDELLGFARELAASALAFQPRLPVGLDIDLKFDYSEDFSHQSRPGQPHLITIGEGMMVHMWNSYVDVWDMYDYDVDSVDPYADYSAFVEWALYHEIGHALVDHSGDEPDGVDHETLADDFATVTMIRLYWQPGEEYVTPAELAAQGLYYLSLPAAARGSAAASGKRNLADRNQPQKRVVNKRHGLEGSLGVHEPNPERAWHIACLVYGAGQAPRPETYQTSPYGNAVCQEGDYSDVVDELATFYAPALQYNN